MSMRFWPRLRADLKDGCRVSSELVKQSEVGRRFHQSPADVSGSHSDAFRRTPFMKLSHILLAVLTPALAFANAIEQAPTPRNEKRAPSQRWGDFSKADAASFRRHVVPLMSRSGCSGRECHGAFSGQGGFQLSLFGYDFEKDHAEITADKEDGSRVDATDAMKSLILTKPTLDEGETHKGKKRWDKGSWEYNLVRKWIESGSKSDVAETGEFDRLAVEPRELVFRKAGDKIQVKVTAYWKDGTLEDVTQLTRFRTNDESVADVSATGLVTSKTRGDTHIVAFYDNGVEAVPAMLPVSEGPFPKVVTRTKVDELVLAKLRKVGIHPSEVCDDDDFLRRASLDVTGTLPTPSEIEAFLADKSADKRARKIDELLSRPGYAAWWTTKLSDFTGNNPRQIRNLLNGGGRNLSGEASRQWYDWLLERVAKNEPYDKLAAGIVLATTRSAPDQSYEAMAQELSGYFKKESPSNFAERPTMPWFWSRQTTQKPEEKAMAFAHTFLGVRIECAQCHKHPFDQWTKTDFEQFQAFFAPVVFGDRNERDAAATSVSAKTIRREIEQKVKSETVAMMDSAESKVSGKSVALGTSALIKALFADSGAPAELVHLANIKRDEARILAKQSQEQQKRSQGETDRRLATGELVPWSELFVDLRRTAEKPRDKSKEVKGGGRVITPKLLGGEEVMLASFNDPRQPLMDWLKGKQNPYFARAFVNRVWAGYFHRGIVEPADDLNLANAPSNAELLDHLAEGFVAKGYDMKWVHREILNSNTYQRSWKTNATNKHDEKNFSHAAIRRLPAEVALDAIAMATASGEKLAAFVSQMGERSIGPVGIQATPGGGGKQAEGYALSIFGRPARETNCDCERVTDPTLLQTIYTRNDQSVLRRLDENAGWLGELRKAAGMSNPDFDAASARKKIEGREKQLAAMKLPEKPTEPTPEALAIWEKRTKTIQADRAELEAKISDGKKTLAEMEQPKEEFNVEKVIREVFLRTVSRPPTEVELANAHADVAAAKSPVEGLRDLLWAMLNTREFLVNR